MLACARSVALCLLSFVVRSRGAEGILSATSRPYEIVGDITAPHHRQRAWKGPWRETAQTGHRPLFRGNHRHHTPGWAERCVLWPCAPFSPRALASSRDDPLASRLGEGSSTTHYVALKPAYSSQATMYVAIKQIGIVLSFIQLRACCTLLLPCTR